MVFEIVVNGLTRKVEAEDGTPLLWVLRDDLGLTGTKYGCGIGQCGSCTVHLDGQPIRACMAPIESIRDARITTIEGIDATNPVRQAWVRNNVPQCGYCQSGQIMSATALLAANPRPDDKAIDEGMNGNLCRCATYLRIRAAIKDAASAT